MPDPQVIHVRPGQLQPGREAQLVGLLNEVADEFVPPLYARSGTTQTVLDGSSSDASAYFFEVLGQHNLLALDDDDLAALLSFRPRHVIPTLERLGEVVYVSTIAVGHPYRRHGHAHAMYDALFTLPDEMPDLVMLRTWSTNTGHIRLLCKLGFTLLHRIENHRGAGIDTVYFGRSRIRP